MRDFSGRAGFGDRFLHWLGKTILRVMGWRPEGSTPTPKKYLLLGVPHTSNWDLVMMLAVCFYFHVRVYWVAKESIFRWPFRGFMVWLGGIPIDRSKSNNLVTQAIEAFKANDELVIAILPEGTRKRVEHWRSGFYHIAMGANVPMVLGYVDYKRKVGGFGPAIPATGDAEADMAKIREFYAPVIGKYPQCQGPIRLKAEENA